MQTYQPVLDAIRRHGGDAYPYECCGFLLGDVTEEGNYVVASLGVKNHAEAEKRHYVIRPEDYVRAERTARRHGLEVVGFYHSHPDAPAQPSAEDLELATFPGFTYVIVSVEDGIPQALTAWSLAADRSCFEPEVIFVRPVRQRSRADAEPAFVPDHGALSPTGNSVYTIA